MKTETLGQQALDVIDAYMHLNVGTGTVNCPYFNNKRSKVRAGLRVLIGKGSAKDITDEVTLVSLREKVDLSALSEDELKQYLIEHNIGIDCSGLAYYILDAVSAANGSGGLKKSLNYPFAKNPIRKLLTKTRPVENVNVKTLADESNSSVVSLKDVRPGDMIMIVGAGYTGVVDHILIVHAVDRADDNPTAIHYTHSFQWSIDGRFAHGVRQGIIRITDPGKPLLDQEWEEQGIVDARRNETHRRASEADSLEIRRLKALS